jgi:heme/copper-type cytochrome/quinol oxidase subunit 3
MVMTDNGRDIQLIKGRKILISAYWIGMIWTISGIATIIYSNIILRSGFNPFLGIPPFNVKSPVATALLIFPGTTILGIAVCIIQKKHKKPLSELVYYFLWTVVLGTIFIIMTLIGIKLFSHN